MEKYNCIIVEDEPLAAEVLEDYVKQTPFLELKAICPDALYATDVLQKEKIDVMFLDIHLPRLKGLDLIKTLKKPPQVILTTAYRDYAIEGYELNVVDYLLKPISFSRFLTAVNKLRNQFNHTGEATFSAQAAPANRSHLFVNVNKKRVKVYLDDILYIESKKEYISIVTKEKSFLTKVQISEIEEQLAKNNFLRIHRSFIVSKDKIEALSASEVEVGGIQLPLGRSYKELIHEQFAS